MGVGTAERLERSVSIFSGTRWRLTEPSVCRHSSPSRWAGLFRAIRGVSIILLLVAAAASDMRNASLTVKPDRRDATICWCLLDLDHDISVEACNYHPCSSLLHWKYLTTDLNIINLRFDFKNWKRNFYKLNGKAGLSTENHLLLLLQITFLCVFLLTERLND